MFDVLLKNHQKHLGYPEGGQIKNLFFPGELFLQRVSLEDADYTL